MNARTLHVVSGSGFDGEPAAAETAKPQRHQRERPVVPLERITHDDSDLVVAVRDTEGVLVMALRGVLRFDSCGQLTTALDQALAAEPARIVIDATGVTGCDRPGLTTVVAAEKRATYWGVPFAMCGLAYRHHRLLPITCADALFHPTLDSALVSVRCQHIRGEPTRVDLLDEIDVLQHTLTTMPCIEQAKGALMATRGLTADAAFDVLRWYSESHNITLRDLAARIVGVLAADSRDPSVSTHLDQLLADARCPSGGLEPGQCAVVPITTTLDQGR